MRVGYDEFCEQVKNEIKNYLPEEYQNCKIATGNTLKNNGVAYDGLSLIRENQASPNIPLQSFYKDYCYEQLSMHEIMERMAQTYLDGIKNSPDFKAEDFQYDLIKEHIFAAVCNAEMNQELLQRVPHERKEDLAVVFSALVLSSQGEKGSCLITNEHLKYWGIDEDTLKAGAFESMKKEMPPIFRSMDLVLKELMLEAEPKELLEIGIPEEAESAMYVLTNPDTFYGASYLFDEKVMGEAAEKLEANLVVLPSSIHEILILREDENTDYDILRDMVKDVNKTQLLPTEILSGEVYRFDRDTHELTIAPHMEQEQAMDMNL